MNARNSGWRVLPVASLAFLVACACAASGQGIEEQGRAVLEKNQNTVVTVQFVIKSKFSMGGMGSEEQESKQESTGFVIDPTGLIVMPLSETDPSAMMDSMMSGMGEAGSQFKMETSLGEVKVQIPGGAEMPAKVVLRDKDLDLAFLRLAEKPAQPLASVDLAQAGDVQVLDQVFALTRLGKVLNRATAVSMERIEAVVKKPRTLYVPGNDPTHSGVGSPVFTADGRILGMIVMRTMKDDTGGGIMEMMGGMKSMVSVVLPAADILDAAKQAPAEAPKEEPAPESSKDSAKESPKEAPEQAPVIIPNQNAAPSSGA